MGANLPAKHHQGHSSPRHRGARLSNGKTPTCAHGAVFWDAILHSVGANATHGLPRSNAAKRRAVELLLRDEEWSKRSDRWIAEKGGVSHPMVIKMRPHLVTVTSSNERLGQDGKTRAMPKRASEPAPVVSSEFEKPEDFEEPDDEPDEPSATRFVAPGQAGPVGAKLVYVEGGSS